MFTGIIEELGGITAVESAGDGIRLTVRAPLAGVIGRSLTTQGALVTSGQPDPLAVIRQLNPVLVDVTQSAAEILAWRRGIRDGELSRADTEVNLILADGSKKSVGVIFPSSLTFNTGAPETMEIIGGVCKVRLAGAGEWQTYEAGQRFEVGAHSSFDIETVETADYVCHFG